MSGGSQSQGGQQQHYPQQQQQQPPQQQQYAQGYGQFQANPYIGIPYQSQGFMPTDSRRFVAAYSSPSYATPTVIEYGPPVLGEIHN